MKNRTINVKGGDIAIVTCEEQDYISFTDMVKNFDGGSALIEQLLKNKDTVLFFGGWGQLNNPNHSNFPDFEGIRIEAGCGSFFLSAKKWIEDTCGKFFFKGGVTEAVIHHAAGDESEPRKPRKGMPA